MNPRATIALAGASGALLGLGAIAACGSRTGLPEGEAAEVADAEPEQGLFTPDRNAPEPSQEPGPRDTAVEEAPLLEADEPDVEVVNPCPDAAATLIYVVGKSKTLYSFDPTTNAFDTIGLLACPDSTMPFSMAVDRRGVAYVEYYSGSLYRVSTRTADCRATRYRPGRYGDLNFGMGFVADVRDGGDGGSGEGGAEGETLYISADNGTKNGELYTLDTVTFERTTIGSYSPPVQEAELTGTGAGRLFAFQPYIPSGADETSGSFIYRIDPSTAMAIERHELLVGGKDLEAGGGWAFAFWGGNFYTFTGPPAGPGGYPTTTLVNRFDPATKALVQVTELTTDTIVGAGVSTCAPTH
jgi:hypothetical protein